MRADVQYGKWFRWRAYDCIMTDCGILDNAANQSGGGVWGGTLDRCAILKNMAITGGGACSGTLNNCVIEENTATDDGGASQPR